MAIKTAPHIVVIMTDQQRHDSIGISGSPWMHTPNLDRIGSEGIQFNDCFCSAPSCVPSRASFFTCTYPHEIDVFHNGDPWTPSWVEQLREAGYHTTNVGKMHTVPMSQNAGFDQRYIVENKDRNLNFTRPHGVFLDEWDKFLNNSGVSKPGRLNYKEHHPLYETALGAYEWALEERFHSDVFVGTMAEWFLDQREADSPLFLQIGFPGPHPPFDPPKKWLEMYDKTDIPLPNLSDEEYALQPVAHKRYRQEMIDGNHDAVRWQKKPEPEQLLRLRRHYAANVSLIDEQVGRVFRALDRNGYLDNCIILFTSDHGDCLGDHGHIQKWTMYDPVVKVPAFLWAPNLIRKTGQVDGLIQQMDLVPLLFSLAGLNFTIPSLCDSAESLLNEASDGRHYVYAEHGPCNMLPDIQRMSMIRSTEWKLVEYRNQPDGELYDLRADPDELVNLWSDSSYQKEQDHLICELKRWQTGASQR